MRTSLLASFWNEKLENCSPVLKTVVRVQALVSRSRVKMVSLVFSSVPVRPPYRIREFSKFESMNPHLGEGFFGLFCRIFECVFFHNYLGLLGILTPKV